MDIVISPPFWQTSVCHVSCSVLLLILIWGGFRLRTRKLRRDRQKLEQRVDQRTEEVVRQKEIVEEKNKEILDSINYAKRIQDAILPTDEMIESHLPESFILYKPKDIVAGDFYWLETYAPAPSSSASASEDSPKGGIRASC